jgi:hypothetical protein
VAGRVARSSRWGQDWRQAARRWWPSIKSHLPRRDRYGADQGDGLRVSGQHRAAVDVDRQSRIVRLGTLRTLGRARLDVVADVLPQPQLDVDRAGLRCSVVGVLLLDDLDRQVLTALVLAPKRQLQLVREVEVSSLTIKAAGGPVDRAWSGEAGRGAPAVRDHPRGPRRATIHHTFIVALLP